MTVVSGDANVVPSAQAPRSAGSAGRTPLARIALLGNPTTGKTTLFNRLTGLRQKTSNFPGTTLEARVGRVRAPGAPPPSPGACCAAGDLSPGSAPAPSPPGTPELIDLPGV